MDKLFINYLGTISNFKNIVDKSEYNNKIVFIKGSSDGNGAAIYARGNYYANIEEVLKEAMAYSDSKFFIGSQEEYDIAYANNKIAIGALVIILDEEELTSDTIALLGTAILGKMILGNN